MAVTQGSKFTDCLAFTDRTASISFKTVNGLAAIDFCGTEAPAPILQLIKLNWSCYNNNAIKNEEWKF